MAHHDRDVVCSPINTHERCSHRTAGCNHTLRRRSRMFKLRAGSSRRRRRHGWPSTPEAAPRSSGAGCAIARLARMVWIQVSDDRWTASTRLTRVAGRSWPDAGMKGTLKPGYRAWSPCLDGNSIANRRRSAARSTNARCVDAVCRQAAHAPNDMSAMRRPRPGVARGIRRL